MNNITIKGGFFEIQKADSINEELTGDAKKHYVIKNIKLIPSPKWRFCIIKIYNIPYKYIYADDLPTDRPYMIEMVLRQQLPSLLCDNMILCQKKTWFNFTVEIVMYDNVISVEPFYECIDECLF